MKKIKLFILSFFSLCSIAIFSFACKSNKVYAASSGSSVYSTSYYSSSGLDDNLDNIPDESILKDFDKFGNLYFEKKNDKYYLSVGTDYLGDLIDDITYTDKYTFYNWFDSCYRVERSYENSYGKCTNNTAFKETNWEFAITVDGETKFCYDYWSEMEIESSSFLLTIPFRYYTETCDRLTEEWLFDEYYYFSITYKISVDYRKIKTYGYGCISRYIEANDVEYREFGPKGMDFGSIKRSGNANYRNLNSIAKVEVLPVSIDREIVNQIYVDGYTIGRYQYSSYYETITVGNKVHNFDSFLKENFFPNGAEISDEDYEYISEYLTVSNNTGYSNVQWHFAIKDSEGVHFPGEGVNYINTNDDNFILILPVEYNYFYSDETDSEGYSYGCISFEVFLDKSNSYVDGKVVYKPDGISLGNEFKDDFILARYNELSVIEAYTEGERDVDRATCAPVSSIKAGPDGLRESPCSICSAFGALKGIELAKGYNKYSHPLIGAGRAEKWDGKLPDNMTSFNGTVGQLKNKDGNIDEYNVCTLVTDSGQSDSITNNRYVFNEVIRLGYHIMKNNDYKTHFFYNEKGVEEYLKTYKSSINWRYVVGESTIYHVGKKNGVSDKGCTESDAYNLIKSYMDRNIPVQIGDEDYEILTSNSNEDIIGHAMLAVGVGITKDGVKEVIYDRGGGSFYAMPISDVDYFWLLDVKYQERVPSYINIFNIKIKNGYKWVDVTY
ncbi:MAG: hypothetical protein K6E20_07230 [Acholeplasmatales bacterium]|nr:hypothetical protein [Acholeplasmatales bacterium]